MQKIYPFKFLDAYKQEDKDIFFGRDSEITQLYEMLFQSDLILIYGASGTGKTSLIQCGLANKSKPYDWFPMTIRRKNNLNDSLDEVLNEAIGTSTQNEDDDFENMFLQEQPLSPLEKKLKDVYKQHFRPIYLIFDQFEELYVLGGKAEQEKFVQTVREIMQIEQPIKIILSIREEYLGSLYEFEKAVPELLRKKLRIEPMNLDKVRQVLEGIDQNPRTNISLKANEQQGITEAIFKKLQGEEKTLFIQLPYLQVFLDKLYRQITQDETHQKEAIFDLESIQKIGDIGNVLRDFLQEQVLRIAQKLNTKDENIWKILSPFTTLEGTKEPLSEAMLLPKIEAELQKIASQVIGELVNARILRYTEKDELYEVSHDTLAKQIASKRSDEEIALLEIDRLIKNQLAFGKDLFTEKQLNVIVPYLEKLSLNTQEKQLITDSQTEAKRQQQAKIRRTRNIRIGVTVFIVGLLGLSVVAVGQWLSAESAKQKAQVSEKKASKALAENIKKDSLNKIEKYNRFLAEAQGLQEQKRYEEAVAKYEVAKEFTTTTTEIDKAIKICNEASGKQSKFDNLLKQAQSQGENYTQALQYYQEALALKIGQAEIKPKLLELQNKMQEKLKTAEDNVKAFDYDAQKANTYRQEAQRYQQLSVQIQNLLNQL